MQRSFKQFAERLVVLDVEAAGCQINVIKSVHELAYIKRVIYWRCPNRAYTQKIVPILRPTKGPSCVNVNRQVHGRDDGRP